MIGSRNNHSDGLSFMVYNPRSIVNKVENVMMTLNDKGIDIAEICETWLSDKILLRLLLLKNLVILFFTISDRIREEEEQLLSISQV